MNISNCPHLTPANVGHLSAEDYSRLTSTLRCDVCPAGPKHLYVCLYPDCYMMGCSEGSDHSTAHNEAHPTHCLQMNVDNRKIWCYLCNNEVRYKDY